MRANFVVSGVWEGIRRNATMTIALILSTAIALSFVGGAYLANTEITHFQKKYESSLNVSVYLCARIYNLPCTGHTTTEQMAALQAQLKAYPAVTDVSPVSEQEAYERAKELQPPDVAKLITVGALPASFTIKLKDIRKDFPKFAETFSRAPGVSKVSNKIDALTAILDIIDGFRLASIVLALVVLVASILLIANTIQVAAAQRRNETSIMRLVGASRWMTELPFMLETIIAVAVGGLIAFGFVTVGRYYLLRNVFQRQVQANVIPDLSINDVLIASGISLIGGIVVSALVAFATLRLYVKL